MHRQKLIFFRVLCSLIFTLLFSGCATHTQMSPNLRERQMTNAIPATAHGSEKPPFIPPRGKKKLLVFFDGTSNQWDSRTNVRRLFEMISGQEDPSILCLYVEGVGADYQAFLGNAFGRGMQKRVAKAYAWLSEYYNEGDPTKNLPADEIYIFGFSRGALQARSLAGLISHFGLLDPDPNLSESKQRWRANKLIDWSQKTCEGVSVSDWEKARTDRIPLFPTYLPCEDQKAKDSFPFKGETRYAEVRFVGVWDTVPGSTFKDYGPTEEMEEWNTGIRYRLGAYPPIHEIAHAVSIHERRKQFRPVLIPEPVPVAGRRTIVHEEWFTGAHSDVGGGYSDSSELPGITLNWMLGFLRNERLFSAGIPTVHTNIAGLQHDQWSDSKFWRLWCPQNRWAATGSITNPTVAVRMALDLDRNIIVVTNGGWTNTRPFLPNPGKRPKHWAGGTTLNVSAAINEPGRAIPTNTNQFLIASWQPWNRTGFTLEKDATYRITAIAVPDENKLPYKDQRIKANPNGVYGIRGALHNFFVRNPSFINPAKYIGPGRLNRVRVLRDGTKQEVRAKFLTVIGAYGLDDSEENVFVIGCGREIKAEKTAELVVFSNDWPGGCGKFGDARFSNSATYPNNTGRILLTIERVSP